MMLLLEHKPSNALKGELDKLKITCSQCGLKKDILSKIEGSPWCWDCARQQMMKTLYEIWGFKN